MALGVEKDVIYHAPWGEERTEEALRAEFRSVTEQIRREGGLPQLNHPCLLYTSFLRIYGKQRRLS